jgi:two-component system NarL family response regulator
MLVDDHPTLRMGLRLILEREPDIQVVAETGDAFRAVVLFNELKPDVTVMDIKLGTESGIDSVDSIRTNAPKAKVIYLTTYDRDEDIYRCIRSGASGYIVKDTPAEDIIGAIRSVHSGRKHFPQSISEKLSDRLSIPDLSEREREVLGHMTAGRSNKEIGAALGLAIGTVKYHINNILGKLQAEDRTQAVVIALRKGFTDL